MLALYFVKGAAIETSSISLNPPEPCLFKLLDPVINITGEVSSTNLPTGSGKGYKAYFCVVCGVYLYCQYNVSKGRVAVRAATLDEPIEPQAHIFVKDKDPWIELPNKDICHDVMYDREKTWPQESLDRIK